LALEHGGPVTALRDDVVEERERFLCALYRVVAAVTRCRPCALGKVSMTRGAGLTRPSSMAAAAGMAMRSSMRASAMRLRNSQRVSGRTK
jgi:AhpD family alkylhydroperoxidase